MGSYVIYARTLPADFRSAGVELCVQLDHPLVRLILLFRSTERLFGGGALRAPLVSGDDIAGWRTRVNTIDLAGKVAIVTGASRGLGRAMAVALARAGARVAIASPQPEPLATAAREIAATAPANGFIAVQADITRRADCE